MSKARLLLDIVSFKKLEGGWSPQSLEKVAQKLENID